MNPLIDKTYFIDEIKITGLDQYDSDQEVALNRFIAKYQKDYLARMFGEELSLTLPAEITDLLVDATLLTSPIANYVYYKWQAFKASITTNAGTKNLNIQNTVSVSPKFKINAAWNEMVEFNQKLYDKLELQETIGDITFSTDIKPYVNTEDDIFKYINPYDY